MHDKKSKQMRTRKEFPIPTKAIWQKTLQIIFLIMNFESFTPETTKKIKMLSISMSFDILLEILARAMKKENEINV